MTAEHVRHNRAFWDADADAYQAAHGRRLAAEPCAWGAWRVPESELCVLGEVTGLDVLEYGCGGAQWAVALAAKGARCVGLDLFAMQLAHARRHQSIEGVGVALVLADAERVPLRDASFDVVFCDHGATSFCDPARTVAEASRLLRPGGLFAFCVTDPLVYLTWDDARDRQTRRLVHGFDALGRVHFGEGTADWALPPGAWIAHFRAHGLVVEDLIHLRIPPGARTTYDGFVPTSWARRWPAEQIWRVRKP
jgi:SAM-dependent methyltransferase